MYKKNIEEMLEKGPKVRYEVEIIAAVEVIFSGKIIDHACLIRLIDEEPCGEIHLAIQWWVE